MLPEKSIDEILAMQDLVVEPVDVPEWGSRQYVGTLTGKERDDFQISCIIRPPKGPAIQNLKLITAKLVAATLRNSDGSPVTKSNGQRIVAADLANKSAAALDRLATVARRLNRLTEDDIEELAKNSSTDPSDDSGSD